MIAKLTISTTKDDVVRRQGYFEFSIIATKSAHISQGNLVGMSSTSQNKILPVVKLIGDRNLQFSIPFIQFQIQIVDG